MPSLMAIQKMHDELVNLSPHRAAATAPSRNRPRRTLILSAMGMWSAKISPHRNPQDATDHKAGRPRTTKCATHVRGKRLCFSFFVSLLKPLVRTGTACVSQLLRRIAAMSQPFSRSAKLVRSPQNPRRWDDKRTACQASQLEAIKQTYERATHRYTHTCTHTICSGRSLGL